LHKEVQKVKSSISLTKAVFNDVSHFSVRKALTLGYSPIDLHLSERK